jgi:hypothetical protein
VPVDYAPLNRWVIKDSPLIEGAFHRGKWPV